MQPGEFVECVLVPLPRPGLEFATYKHGLPAATIARLTCPIGIPGIKGKEPGTIAVAVAAQLLEQRSAAERAPSAAAEA